MVLSPHPPITGDLGKEAVFSAFHRLDADGSGSISPDDLRKVIGASVVINISLFIVIWWGFIVIYSGLMGFYSDL